MRACVLTATGGLDHLQITDVPDAPAPQAGELRIAIRAAALNHLDLFVAEGMPGGADRFPHIVGADGAGVVESVGPDVKTVKVGDRVMLNPGISDYTCEFCRAGEHSLCVNFRLLGEHLPGTMAELVTIPAHNVARIPQLAEELTWAEAAAFSLVTLTAWRMLVTRAQLKAGETVLIWGIGGGVSLTGMRIAKLLGARTIVTSSDDDNAEPQDTEDLAGSSRTHQQARRGCGVRQCRRRDLGGFAALSAARGPAGDVRRDVRTECQPRSTKIVLASLEHSRLDDGKCR